MINALVFVVFMLAIGVAANCFAEAVERL